MITVPSIAVQSASSLTGQQEIVTSVYSNPKISKQSHQLLTRSITAYACLSRFSNTQALLAQQPTTTRCAVQYRDLPHNVVLAVTVWQVSEGEPLRPLGGATMRLFSKQGRLKTGTHQLRLWEGQEADPAWPTTTPGKEPVNKRGEIGYGNLDPECQLLPHCCTLAM